MSDDEWMETYSNKVMEDSYRPRVGSRRDEIYQRLASQRHIENADDVADSGMDIGDYDFIDQHLFHCPSVNWVE